MNKLREKSMGCVFLVTALASIFAVIIICLFLFANGLPTIAEIGPFDFLLGTTWKPTNDIYGIFPMILGSIYVTAGSLIIGVPVGFVNVVESKERILTLPTPHIVARGRKGGSNVAAAICNALLYQITR